jgi:DNA-binding transcriptional ArsR family regulator
MNPLTFQALAEPNRFQIVELLREKPMPVGELADTLHIRQPQASKHLKVLADAGIVEVRPQANQRIYELSPKKFKEIDAWLEKYRKIWEDRFDRLDAFLQKEKQKGVNKYGRK